MMKENVQNSVWSKAFVSEYTTKITCLISHSEGDSIRLLFFRFYFFFGHQRRRLTNSIQRSYSRKSCTWFLRVRNTEIWYTERRMEKNEEKKRRREEKKEAADERRRRRNQTNRVSMLQHQHLSSASAWIMSCARCTIEFLRDSLQQQDNWM